MTLALQKICFHTYKINSIIDPFSHRIGHSLISCVTAHDLSNRAIVTYQPISYGLKILSWSNELYYTLTD